MIQKSDAKKKVGIVGYGNIGPAHACSLENIKKAEFYAVCDIDEERIRFCQEKYKVIAYTDYDEMLKDPKVECVHICTPHYLHFEMIKKALKAGKAVISEKPIAMTKEQFEELQRLQGVERVCAVLQNRLIPCIRRFKEIVDTKEYGEIITAKGILTWNRNPAYYQSGNWRGKWATEGGGVLINQAVHTLDLFDYLVGKVISLQAHMCNYSLQNVIEVEDTFSASLVFENGVRGVFFATNAYGVTYPPEFEIVFEEATVRWSKGKLWVDDTIVCEDTVPIVGKPYWGTGHEALFQMYYEENRPIRVCHIKNTMNTMFAMYESARNGGRIINIS